MEICCVDDDEVVYVEPRSKRVKTEIQTDVMENSVERLEKLLVSISEKAIQLPLRLVLNDRESAALVTSYTEEVSSLVGKYTVLCEVMVLFSKFRNSINFGFPSVRVNMSAN